MSLRGLLFSCMSCACHAQASVGTLVGKTLLTSTSNPYAAGGGGARLANTPAALDVFGIQALPGHSLLSVLRAARCDAVA